MEYKYFSMCNPIGLINKDWYQSKKLPDDAIYLHHVSTNQTPYDKDRIIQVKQMSSNKVSRDYTLPLKPLAVTSLPSNEFFSFLDSSGLSHLYYKVPIQMIEKGTKRIVEEYTGILLSKQLTKTIPVKEIKTEIDQFGNLRKFGRELIKDGLYDDRLFSIGGGTVIFREDIKERLDQRFPGGIFWFDVEKMSVNDEELNINFK